MKKSDEILKEITQIKVTLGEQHVTLKDHIRRTEILETKVAPLEKQHAVTKFLFHSSILTALIEGAHRLLR